MGDVFAFFGALLAIGIALPGMLLAWALLFRDTVARAQARLERTPWRCFWLGAAWLSIGVPLIVALVGLPAGPVQFVGWTVGLAFLAFASLGAAGLAALLGERLRAAGMASSVVGATLRGAIALELAAAFPVIGWFAVIPLAAICSLGAAGFALLRREPRAPAAAVQPPVVGQQPAPQAGE